MTSRNAESPRFRLDGAASAIAVRGQVQHRVASIAPLLAVIASFGLAGCGTAQPALYKNEEFTSANAYARSFPGDGATTCEAARRALLSQGYIVTEAKPSAIKATKNFQRGRDSHAELEFSVVCAANSEGSNSTTAFANAVRETYSLKKTSNSASVGVGVLGSLSVPFGSSDESMVKVGAETIDSPKFYDQFFTRLESYLDPGALKPVKPKPAAAPVVPSAPAAADPTTGG